MKVLDRILDTLPGPYALAADAVLTQFLDVVAAALLRQERGLRDRRRKA